MPVIDFIKEEIIMHKDVFHLNFIGHFDNQYLNVFDDYKFISHLFLDYTLTERKEDLCGKSW